MKVFISWSGNLSKNLAEIFKQWLPSVIQAVKPYYSPDDISKGARWESEISKELETSQIGIICLTQENLEAPWIMFEAGALSKNIEKSKVCPILFGVEPSEIKGPLVPFQAAKFSKNEMKKVVKMMNQGLGENGLASDVFEHVFEKWWPELKENVDKALKETTDTEKKSSRTDRDLLEEILELTRKATLTNNVTSKVDGEKILHLLYNSYADSANKDDLLKNIENYVLLPHSLSINKRFINKNDNIKNKQIEGEE